MGTDTPGGDPHEHDLQDPPELQEFDRLRLALVRCDWHDPAFKEHLARFEAFMARQYAAMMQKYPKLSRGMMSDLVRAAREHVAGSGQPVRF